MCAATTAHHLTPLLLLVQVAVWTRVPVVWDDATQHGSMHHEQNPQSASQDQLGSVQAALQQLLPKRLRLRLRTTCPPPLLLLLLLLSPTKAPVLWTDAHNTAHNARYMHQQTLRAQSSERVMRSQRRLGPVHAALGQLPQPSFGRLQLRLRTT